MEQINLDVQVRQKVGSRKIKSIRREKQVPAIVYGGKNAPTNVQVERNTYERIMRQHQGQSVVFHLNVKEGSKKLRDYVAIVKEEQHHPVDDRLVHIDFNRISLKDEIHMKIPIQTNGEAVGVKRDGGSLDQALWEIEIICLPTNIPPNITVDVSNLEIGNAVHVKELTLPEGVKTKHDEDAIVVSVVPPMKEVEAEPQEAPDEVEATKEKPKEAKEEAKPEAKAEAKSEDKSEKK